MAGQAQTDPYADIATDPYASIASSAPTAGAAPAPAAAPAPVPKQPATPVGAWQSLKNHIKENLDKSLNEDGGGIVGDVGRGFAKEGVKSIGGLLDIYRNLGDVASPKDVEAYMKEHPGSTADEALSAVRGQHPTEPGKTTTPYRSADNRNAQSHLAEASKWFADHAHTDGFWEGLGGVGENIAELLTPAGLEKLAGVKGGAEAAKVAGFVDKLKDTHQIATVLEKYPALAKLVGLGVRTAHAAAKSGAEIAGQTFMKTGGDTDAALKAGAIGAAGAGVITPVAEGAAAAVRHLAPDVAKVAGEEVPILKSQQVMEGANGEPINPSRVQQSAATTENSPTVKGKQQAGAKRTITQEAQGVVERNISENIEVRRPAARPAPQEARRPGANATAAKVDPVSGEPISGEPNHTGPIRPGTSIADDTQALTPGSPELMSGGDSELALRDGLATRDGLGQPRGQFRAQGELPGGQGARVTTEPLPKELPEGRMRDRLGSGAPQAPEDIPRRYARSAIKSVGNFGDAAEEFRKVARVGYDYLNEQTNGRWQAVNDQISALTEKANAATDPEARAAAKSALAAAERNGNRMIEDSGLKPEDVAGMKRAWSASYDLQALHDTIEGAFDISENLSKNDGVYRGFNGDQLNRSFKRLLEDKPRIRQWIGDDGVTNLERVFAYNRTGEGRKRFGNAVSDVAGWLARHTAVTGAGAAVGHAIGGVEGAAGGAATAEAVYKTTRYVMHKIATDPKFSKNLMFALDAGADPKMYAPYLGGLISKGVSDNTDKEPQQ